MNQDQYAIEAKVWLYKGPASWHFVTLPKKQADILKKRYGLLARGWGSLPVTVTIGKTTWKTSIFPDTKSNSYLLPIKKEARVAEKINVDDNVKFTIQVRL